MEGLRIAILFLGSFLVGILSRALVREDLPLPPRVPEVHLAAEEIPAISAYRFVSWKQMPSLQLRSTADTQGGVNIQVQTRGFTFAPQHLAKDKWPTYGYATVTLNGKEVGRVYQYRFYIDPARLVPGINVLTVTLYTTLHQKLITPEGTALSANIFITKP